MPVVRDYTITGRQPGSFVGFFFSAKSPGYLKRKHWLPHPLFSRGSDSDQPTGDCPVAAVTVMISPS